MHFWSNSRASGANSGLPLDTAADVAPDPNSTRNPLIRFGACLPETEDPVEGYELRSGPIQ